LLVRLGERPEFLRQPGEKIALNEAIPCKTAAAVRSRQRRWLHMEVLSPDCPTELARGRSHSERATAILQVALSEAKDFTARAIRSQWPYVIC
jgi:hypothetical protein